MEEMLDNRHDQLVQYQYVADYMCAYAVKWPNVSSKLSPNDPVSSLVSVITEMQKENEVLRKSNHMLSQEKKNAKSRENKKSNDRRNEGVVAVNVCGQG